MRVCTTLGLIVTGTATTIVLSPSTVKDLACFDFDDFAIGLSGRGRWHASSVGVASQSDGQEGQKASEHSGLHPCW